MLNENESESTIKIVVEDTDKKGYCDKCSKDISELFIITEDSFEEEVEYNNKEDLLVCESCYNKEISFSTTQNQRRISNPKEKAYIIYSGKLIGSPELTLNRLSLSFSSGSHPSAVARKKEKELEKEVKGLKAENSELKGRIEKLEELVQQLLNTRLQEQQEQPPK